jgi:hypothetical protein
VEEVAGQSFHRQTGPMPLELGHCPAGFVLGVSLVLRIYHPDPYPNPNGSAPSPEMERLSQKHELPIGGQPDETGDGLGFAIFGDSRVDAGRVATEPEALEPGAVTKK